MSDDRLIMTDNRGRESRIAKNGVTGEAALDSKAKAEARAREIRENKPDGGSNRDRYWAPPAPEGWTYEWKMRTVMNEEQPDYITETERNGWQPVDLKRHPELMPKGWKGSTIEVGGLVLMERPSIFTEEARAEEQRAAREAVLTKEAQLREGRAGDLGKREVQRFSKSRGPIQVSDSE